MTALAATGHGWTPGPLEHDPGPVPEADPDVRVTYVDPDTLLREARRLQLEVTGAAAAAAAAGDQMQADAARRAAVMAATRLVDTLAVLDRQLVAGGPSPTEWST